MIERVCFIGSKEMGLRALQSMCEAVPGSLCQIVTLNDSSDKRSQFDKFEEFAKKNKIPCEVVKQPQQLGQLLEKLQPQLCVVVGWYWIIKPDVLKIPKFGFVGAHASLLPRYRGGAPLVWTLINGEREGGITLFYFDEQMDSGDVIAQYRFPILPLDDIADLLRKAEKGLAALLQENYPLLLRGRAPRSKQDLSQATYCSQRRPEDGIINWQQGHMAVFDFIRAQTRPYPGAFTSVKNGQRIYVWKATPFPHGYLGPPGRVVQSAEDHVVVTCGRGALRIYEVEVNDWGPVAAPEILQVGAQLV